MDTLWSTMNDHKIGLTVFLIKPDQVAALEKALLIPGADSIPLSAPLDGFSCPLRPLAHNPNGLELCNR